jgi:outer membrane protein TolC
LELAERQYAGVKRLVAAGVFTNVEQLVAESGVQVRRDAAIRSETNVRLAERELKRIMQRPDAPVNSPTQIYLTTEPNPLGLVFDRESLTARAIDNRMEMLQLQLQLLSQSIESGVQRNSILPRLDLTAELDMLGLESSYRKSMDVLFDNDFGDRLLGVALEVPLSGNVSARARLREVQLRMMQTRIQQERTSVLITQEVYDAIDLVEQNWERVVVTQQAELAAQRAYEGQLRLQEAGRATVTDVLVALASFGDAKAQAVQAVVDYQIAKVDLALAAGAMLGYGQVDWNPCRGPQSPLPDLVAQQMEAAESTVPPSTALQLPPMMLPVTPDGAATPTPLQLPPVMLPVTPDESAPSAPSAPSTPWTPTFPAQ